MPVHLLAGPVSGVVNRVRLISPAASVGFPSPAGDDLGDEIDPIA